MTGLRLIVALSHVLLGLGLAAPCMTVTPQLGEHTGIAKWLGLLEEPRTYSLLEGIRDLLVGGSPAIGVVLLIFSVLFPIAKLIALRHALHVAARDGGSRAGWVDAIGKYSMVDVFVIALIVVVSKSFPGGTEVAVRWGVFPFAAAALLSVWVTRRLRAEPAA